jgi:hypothetical protein
MSRPSVLLLPMLLALAYCAPPPPPPPVGQTRADAATREACREHADQVYDRQHRDTIYTISSRDTPFSANDSRGVIDNGLSQRYGRDNMLRDCVRNNSTEPERPTATVAPGPTKP